MPNIMLTYRCNLNCPYCFANEFVNSNDCDITLENFEKAVDFLTSSGNGTIGLIGGEPTIHRYAQDIFKRVIENKKIESCVVYTNGLKVDEFENLLSTPKFRLLFNCNSYSQIGEKNYNKLRDNIRLMINEHYMKQRVNLGINLYSDAFDYLYIFELLKEFSLHRVRISLTVPNNLCGNDCLSLDYFLERKKYLLDFLKVAESAGVVPYYDCNKPPMCIWDDEEMDWLKRFVQSYGVNESNLISDCAYCLPVIDVLPDLSAVRCFGMSNYIKTRIDNFKTYDEIVKYYQINCDERLHQIITNAKCEHCYDKAVGKCMAGCIAFSKCELERFNNMYSVYEL